MPKKIKRLFFDIETSPNIVWSWGLGSRIRLTPENMVKERKIICIAYRWEGDSIKSLQWTAKQDDGPMLRKFAKIIEKADEAIAHNGDEFDIRWLRTRCAVHGVALSPHIPTFDTLKKARARFRFNSNSLDYIAKYFGFGGKHATGPGLWKSVVLDNDKEALRRMVSYCENDVAILERVYYQLAEYTTANVHHGLIAGKGKASCPSCASTDVRHVRSYTTASGSLKNRMSCQNCASPFFVSKKVLKDWKEAA